MIITQMIDLTCHQDLLAQLEQLEQHYNVLTETVSEAIIRIDETFKIVFANSAVRHTFGYEKEELLGESFRILLPPEIFSRHQNEFRKYFIVDSEHRSELGLKRSMEVLGRHKSRGVSPMEMSFGNSSDFQGRTLTCIIRDITGRKNIERQLRKLAYHDRLTNLGNRDLFNTDMKDILGQLEKYPMLNGALMFLDLDGFKQINDTLGHNVGDELLLLTAGRLRECLRESDSIYRFGGDEFVVMLPKIDTKQDAITVARKILAAVRRPYYLHAKKASKETSMVTIGVSIGIALFPGHGSSIQILIQNADLAMYESKNSGKNRFTVYDSSLVSKATLQLKIEQGLKNALNNGLFRLHYQPMVDKEGKLTGVEALLRWKDEELGEIPPSQFIPIAEEKGLIVPLGNWVLEKACRDIAELHKTVKFNFPVSINVSPIQWREASFVANVVNIINRTGIRADMVKLEITEQSLMENPDEVIDKLTELKTMKPGLQIAIDDFGTGYSSLSYLSRLPADSLKIDISFTAHIDEQHNRKIIRTILTMAESLELEVVVEGIETEAQWDFFHEEDCSTLQGFFFSRPIPLSILKKSLIAGGQEMSFPV
jgi:diguanylate cyclase (GGDEF)-like protein/PAS domain S-box-containing protein